METDVIVVGAGPAGCFAAYIQAKQSIRVTIFEKTPLPRCKVCGGWLTHKIMKEISFDLSPVIETTIHSFRFSHKYANAFTRHSDLPLKLVLSNSWEKFHRLIFILKRSMAN